MNLGRTDELHINKRGRQDMKIAIATDTNSGITQNMIREEGLYVLPMPVIVDEQIFMEGIDIDSRQLYEAMKEHRDISTSQPSPGSLMELWDTILRDGYEEIVYIPMSSGLSGSCESAIQFSADYEGKVHVVDNHRISVTQKESVYSAYRLAQQGYSAKEIKAYLEERTYDASIYITVDSLEYLKKGGRITPAVAALATILNLKPVLTIQGDKLDTYKKARGMRQAQTSMIEAVIQDRRMRFADVPDSQLQIETAGTFESQEQARQWLSLVQEKFVDMEITYSHLPCCIACHVGMNAAGIAIMKKEV